MGILSTGNIARQFATGALSAQRCVLAAVGSRELAGAKAFADAYRIAFAFGSYAELVNSPEVDAVYNALPNSLHHEWTLAALNAGKHVLCEKPLASDARQAREMFDGAERTGRVLVEAFMYRSHPQTLGALEAVRSGAIGDLKLIRTSFCYRTRRVEGNIRFDPNLAGGGLMDIGCYCIDFSRLFAGSKVVRVDVTGHVHDSGVDDLAAGTLTFANGIIASFTCGMTLQADNTAYLCGSEGYIEIPVPWKPPLEKAGFTIARGTPPKMDAVGQPAPAAPPREWRATPSGALYALEADDFAATVLDRQSPRVSRADSVGTMEILDLMRGRLGIL
ncbi:MAG TPA: Gfo/Idh/MocA family oxidoreductase [Tepidisphaeraceae bacterium]|jgi:predicted dehydrogenase